MMMMMTMSLGHPGHGCPRCFLPVRNFTLVKFMLAAGAYSWHL